MYMKHIISIIILSIILSACGTVSSSSAPTVAITEQTNGPIYITTASIPNKIEYVVIGSIKANARSGYDSTESLYPLIANEAKKVGANAVIEVYGGRSVSAFSWSAPYVGGIAIRVKDIEKLKQYGGQYY